MSLNCFVKQSRPSTVYELQIITLEHDISPSTKLLCFQILPSSVITKYVTQIRKRKSTKDMVQMGR